MNERKKLIIAIMAQLELADEEESDYIVLTTAEGRELLKFLKALKD